MDYAAKRLALQKMDKKALIDQALKYYMGFHQKNDAISDSWNVITDLITRDDLENIYIKPHLSILANTLEIYTSYED